MQLAAAHPAAATAAPHRRALLRAAPPGRSLLHSRCRTTAVQHLGLRRARTQALPEAAAVVAEAASAAAAAAAPDPQAGADAKLVTSYVVLGLAAASFATTFFVLPQFRELLKEPVQWSEIYKALVQKGNVKALPPSDVMARVKRGAVLLDVRLQERYDGLHAEGSTCVPLYRPILGWDVASTLRRVAFSLFGIFPGTELNPAFLSDLKAAVPKGKEVVLMCESGGSLENKPGVKFGFQSRSLKAAYFLLQAGYSKVSFCQGGFPRWQREGLAVASSSDES